MRNLFEKLIITGILLDNIRLLLMLNVFEFNQIVITDQVNARGNSGTVISEPYAAVEKPNLRTSQNHSSTNACAKIDGFISLCVPYLSQVFDSSEQRTRSGIPCYVGNAALDATDCACGPTSAASIIGFFSPQEETYDELRETVFNSDIIESQMVGNQLDVGGYNISMCTPGLFGIMSTDGSSSSCDITTHLGKNIVWPLFDLKENVVPVTSEAVKAAVDNGNPIMAGMSNNHIVVIKGYSQDGNLVLVNDPLYNQNESLGNYAWGEDVIYGFPTTVSGTSFVWLSEISEAKDN